MRQGIEHAHESRLMLTRIIGALFGALIFVGGAIGILAYLTPETPPQPVVHVDENVVQAQAIGRAFPTVSIEGKSAIVYDIASGQSLYEKSPDVQLPLASLTKVPLALAISEVLPTYTELIIPRTISQTSTLTELKKGSRWRSQDLVDLTLVASSNDGAQILASAADDPLRARYPAAPPGSAAVYRMNILVQGLGLTHTYFVNPTGLDETTDQSGAYGTARDMAKLFAYAATSAPDIFVATTKPLLTVTSVDGERASAKNTDHALSDIPGLILGKTGYTDLAGGNLAIVFAPAGGRTLVAVVLGSTEQGRFDDMRTLVAAAQSAIASVSTKLH